MTEPNIGPSKKIIKNSHNTYLNLVPETPPLPAQNLHSLQKTTTTRIRFSGLYQRRQNYDISVRALSPQEGNAPEHNKEHTPN